jgi:hypothetical protein
LCKYANTGRPWGDAPPIFGGQRNSRFFLVSRDLVTRTCLLSASFPFTTLPSLSLPFPTHPHPHPQLFIFHLCNSALLSFRYCQSSMYILQHHAYQYLHISILSILYISISAALNHVPVMPHSASHVSAICHLVVPVIHNTIYHTLPPHPPRPPHLHNALFLRSWPHLLFLSFAYCTLRHMSAIDAFVCSHGIQLAPIK